MTLESIIPIPEVMQAKMEQLITVLDFKARQFAEGRGYSHAEALKVLHPLALHGGL